MKIENAIQRYRRWYAALLRLYPRRYQERFAEQMLQTFVDLLRDQGETRLGVFRHAASVFLETSADIIVKKTASWMSPRSSLFRVAAATLLILLVPLLAMQFTDEVQWDVADFLVMGGFLFATGLAYAFVAKRSGRLVYRAAFGLGLVAAFLLGWVNGAVGIIGNEGNPANLMFAAVFLVGLAGAVAARLRPAGMARTLFAAATAQMLVPVFALLIWPPPATSWSPSVLGVFALTAFFAALFAVSGLLFRRASLNSPLSEG